MMTIDKLPGADLSLDAMERDAIQDERRELL